MGFLRKVGRKIKKGVKKLFSSKIGAFLGSMALSMILGPVIGRAFNGIKGAVMGTGATATQAAATAATQTTAAAAQTAAAEAGKKALVEKGLEQSISKSLLAESGKKLTEDEITRLISGETLQSVASKEVAGKALSKEAIKSSFGTGLSKEAIKSSISTTGLNPADLTNFLTEKVATNTMPINMSNTVTGSLNNFNDFLETGDMFKSDSGFNNALDIGSAKNATEAAKIATQTAKDTKLFGDGNLKSDIKENFKDLGTDIKEFGKDPIGKTKEIVGEDFIADTAKAVGSSYLSEMMSEPQVDEGGYGRVINAPALEAAQGNYLQNVASNYQSAFNTRVKSFDEIMQQAMYGTATPQFMTPYKPITGN